MAKGAGIIPDANFDDLDWFIGSKTIDTRPFEEAQEWLDSLPKDMT